MSPKKVIIVYNPISGRGQSQVRAKELAAHLNRCGHSASIQESKPAYVDGELGATFRNFDLVLLCGGDGSLQKLLPSLIESQTPIFMIPTGNESLFAREFSMHGSLAQLEAALEAWQLSQHFVPTYNSQPFFTMLSIGLDSEVVAAIAKNRRTTIGGSWGYILPTLRAACHHSPPLITLKVDGDLLLEQARGFFIVANTSQYAAGLKFVPNAESRTQILNAGFYPYQSVWKYLRWSSDALLGQAPNQSGAKFFQGKHFEISGAHHPVQVDGEFAGYLPAVVNIGSEHITVLAAG